MVFVQTILDCISSDYLSSSVSLSAISRVLYFCTVSDGCAIFIEQRYICTEILASLKFEVNFMVGKKMSDFPPPPPQKKKFWNPHIPYNENIKEEIRFKSFKFSPPRHCTLLSRLTHVSAVRGSRGEEGCCPTLNKTMVQFSLVCPWKFFFYLNDIEQMFGLLLTNLCFPKFCLCFS